MKETKVTENIYFFTDDSILKDLSNSSIIFTEKGPVVIDTFGTPKQWKTVEAFIKKSGYLEPYAVIFTHGHFDHILGNQAVNPNYSIYAHESTVEVIDEAKEKRLPRIIEAGYLPVDIKMIYPTVTFKDEMRFEIGSCIFRLIYTPGHSKDSITVYEESSRIAFTGDNLIEIEGKIAIPNFDYHNEIDKKSNSFLNTLNKLKSLNADMFIQGHGDIINPRRYFSIIEKYNLSILSFVERLTLDNKDMIKIDSIAPDDVFDKNLIEDIFDINGKYSTFKANLLSAYNSVIKKQ